MPFEILSAEAHSILTRVSGFLAEAGFTHSLSPARNCTFGCSYCYVPTMRVQAGLRPDDWRHWGERTTFKTNAAHLLSRSLREDQRIYCSPLTDPYQPAEEQMSLMPGILDAVAARPPRVFTIQTRSRAILRDLGKLTELAKRTTLRVGFSITTDREDIRRIFEPHCASVAERWQTVEALRAAGIAVSVTVAPILPCDPEALIRTAIATSNGPVIADPLHVRLVKRSGATTREAALAICTRHGWEEWLEPSFHRQIIEKMARVAAGACRAFDHGPRGFALLARTGPPEQNGCTRSPIL